MADDYFKTAKRMNDDAKTLHNIGRHYNACYLAGYVAECYTKHILQKVAKDSTGRQYNSYQIRGFRHDIDALMNEVCHIAANIPMQCRIDMRANCPNLWSTTNKWNPNDRYENNPNWNDPVLASSYVNEADGIFNLMAKLIYVEGVLPI